MASIESTENRERLLELIDKSERSALVPSSDAAVARALLAVADSIAELAAVVERTTTDR